MEAKSAQTLTFLMKTLAEVLEDVGQSEIVPLLPWRGSSHRLERFPDAVAEDCVRAYSLAFQLLDQAEENAIAQARRRAQDEGRIESGSWAQNFTMLKDLGFDEAEVARRMKEVRVEPVLTAHPTEAKRQTVLQHQRTLYRTLVDLENSMWTRSERDALEAEVRASIERLYRTGEVHLQKPSLEDERRMVLHYLERVFPGVLPWVHRSLRAAWVDAGWDPAAVEDAACLPKLTFGNWVGGDRDGHPYVTPAFTRETLELFRNSALRLVDQGLQDLAVALSLSKTRQQTPDGLGAAIEAEGSVLDEAERRFALDRNPDEPWRQYVNLLRQRLPRDASDLADSRFREAGELALRLERLDHWLREVGARRLASSDLVPVQSLVRSFGFHLAEVDVRQNSAFYDRGLAQLLIWAGVEEGGRFPEWDEARKRRLLDEELNVRRPFAGEDVPHGDEAQDLVQLFRTLRDHRRRYGDAGLGALIVSMTRSAEDLLTVHLFAREGGLRAYDEQGEPWTPLPVVPLFETIEDLRRAPEIMDDYLQVPLVKRSLERMEEGSPVQQVMIGYSDSGKDGGIVASIWSLYRAQQAVAEVGRRHGVRIRFFHGRGGTIGRGAGPTHRFVRALPPNSLQSDLRVTVQGETIRQNFANRVTASHHLELLTACAVGTSIADLRAQPAPEGLAELMDRLQSISQKAYRDLVEHQGFVPFFENATPIDAIEASQIGSRPARRKGTRSLENLRAIPWVFSWNQSRFILSGWFGLGTGLARLREEDPTGFERLREAKREATRWSPFHYLISNAATAWASANPEIMGRYAALAEGQPHQPALFDRIREEYELTREGLERIYEGPLSQVRADIHRALARRDEALRPLHMHQLSLLTAWRERQPDPPPELTRHLLRTVNAIASGLGATG